MRYVGVFLRALLIVDVTVVSVSLSSRVLVIPRNNKLEQGFQTIAFRSL
jgi:hypothetical protein